MVTGERTHKASYFLAAARLAEKYGRDDPRLHIALHNAAFKSLGPNPALAESLLKRDISNLERLDVNFPGIVRDCYELGTLYEGQRRYAEAEPLLLRAIAIHKKWQDIQSDDPFNAEILVALYFMYYVQGRYDEAKQVHAQMIDAVQHLHAGLTRFRCLSAVRQHLSGYVQYGQGLRPEQKQHFLEMAFEFSREALSYFHSGRECADELQDSAILAFALGDPKKAERLARQSLDMAATDPDCMPQPGLRAAVFLCQILSEQQRYKETKEVQNRCLAKLAQLFGTQSADYKSALNLFSTISPKKSDLHLPINKKNFLH